MDVRSLLSLLALPLLCAACGDDPAPTVQDAGPPVVYTTFHPTTYFVERLAGDAVEVVCPLPADADPIFWQPSRDVLAAYQTADLIVLNGAEFEKWPATASLPASRVLESVTELEGGFVQYEASTHRHGMTGEHTHEGIDGHTWVDPRTARVQAKTIAEALIARWPELAKTVRTNLAALTDDLDALDARLRALTPRLQGVTLLASHPAYNYLARRHGWQMTNFDLDPAEALASEQLEGIEQVLVDGASPILLWEAEPLPETAQLLRERVGIESVLFSPAEAIDPAAYTAGENYLTVMRANLDRLEAVLPNGE